MSLTNRFCSPTGAGAHDGTSAGDAWTLAEAVAGYAAGQRINTIAGTYANTSNNRVFSTAGTTTAPAWFAGYKVTPGDLDTPPSANGVAGTDLPLWSFTTGYFGPNAAHLRFSSLAISCSSTSQSGGFLNGGNVQYNRCRFEATGANAASSALTLQGGSHLFEQCFFKATGAATRVLNLNGATVSAFRGCPIAGGGHGIEVTSAGGVVNVRHCTFRSNGSDGMKMTAAPFTLVIDGCTFSRPGANGINFAALSASNPYEITGCTFSRWATYAINNSTGTNTAFVLRSANTFYNVGGTGVENGFGDAAPFVANVTEAGDPLASATDLSLVTGASSLAAGMPGIMENESYSSYLDAGGVQKQAAGGGGGGGGRGIYTGGRL